MKKVLLIDGSPMFTEFLAEKFKAESIGLETAGGSRDAYTKIIMLLPDLIIIESETGIDMTVQDLLDRKIADSDYVLTIYDPQATDSKGNPIRMVRRAETNLGDFCADAIRAVSGADIAMVNGGGVRANLAAGDITYGNLVKVHPFGNQICMIRATGQQILDALEWSVHAIPDEFGGFLQVSGMRFEVDVTIPSSCLVDENGMFAGIRGKRRVTKAWVGDEELNPKKTYVVAGIQYTLLQGGDGYTAFQDAELLAEEMKLDVQVLIDYITDTLQGRISGEAYADPYGQERIVIHDGE